MTRTFMSALIGVMVLSGCAHSLMRGTVAMKVSETEAHVCLGEGQVKTGDKVAFLVNQCSGGSGKTGTGRDCQLIKVGEGQVRQLLNNHYSIVKADAGVKLDEGTLVEKL